MRAFLGAACLATATLSACGYFPDGTSQVREPDYADAATVIPDAPSIAPSCATDCGEDVCSALQQCVPASTVRTITVYWTVRGRLATSSTCASIDVSKVVLSLAASGPQGIGSEDLFVLPKLPCTDGMVVIENVPDSVDRLGAGLDDFVSLWLDMKPTMQIDLQYTIIEL